MSRIIIKSFRKQLKQVRHQLVTKLALEQDEKQMQPMINELVNAPNTYATQRGEVNEQHENVVKLVMPRDLVLLSTTRQETP